MAAAPKREGPNGHVGAPRAGHLYRMTSTPGELLDERSVPDLRDRFGQLAQHSTQLAVAVRRIRLTGVDLTTAETASLRRIRVLVSELNAGVFGAEADCVMIDPSRRPIAERLVPLLGTGVLEVRVAPLAFWSPDFSIFFDDARPQAAILGVHWFQRPFPHDGPAFATLYGQQGAAAAAGRFEELWTIAYDVSQAVESILAAARERANTAATWLEKLRMAPPRHVVDGD